MEKAEGEEQFCFQCTNIKHSQAKATKVLFGDPAIVGAQYRSSVALVDGTQKAEALVTVLGPDTASVDLQSL